MDGYAGIGVVMASNPTGVPAIPAIPLLTTKLFVPRARADLVVRPRLLDRLAHPDDGCRCTLLSAPAGAGKTTLLAAWLATRELPAAWLSLDERDQDVHRFVRYLVAAFQSVAPGCGTTTLAWLDVPEAAVEAVLTSLVNDVARLPDGTLLVLDDYHLVRSTGVHEAVGFLLEHLPPSTSLVLSTREDPPLPMARLRGRGELRELRAADFSFTVDEASELLVDGMGLPLSPAHVVALVTRTEGWAAGLQLAGLAMRSHADVAAFVTAFTGSHRLVADYLAAEVLDRQPARLRRFLLTTSVLDRMSAPLCDAVLAETGAQCVLDKLERTNLFVVPLDDERVWFRYHHLFAQVLRVRLAAEDPTAAAAVHRRAATWFGSAGLLPESVDHALAAGDVDDAAARIEAVVPMMLADHDIDRAMTGWLEALPAPTVRARPALCLARAWHAIHAPRIDEAIDWVAAAERTTPEGPAGRRFRGATAALRALASVFQPSTAPAVAQGLAERALADLPAWTSGSAWLRASCSGRPRWRAAARTGPRRRWPRPPPPRGQRACGSPPSSPGRTSSPCNSCGEPTRPRWPRSARHSRGRPSGAPAPGRGPRCSRPSSSASCSTPTTSPPPVRSRRRRSWR